jgi:uncharacterized protein
MFDSPEKLALGFVAGILFGFLLQKGRVAKFEVILGQFLLQDWRVLKIMLTAIAVGSVGVYALVEGDLASLSVKPFEYGGISIGAVLFGIGMAVFGLCPGTSVAACGEGSRHAMVGVMGMLVGAALFVAAYPFVDRFISAFGNAGELTVPDWLRISPWLAIACLLLLITAVLMSVEYLERRSRHERTTGTSGIQDPGFAPRSRPVRSSISSQEPRTWR